MSLLDILFPKFCIQCKAFGSYLCPKCFSYISFSDTGFCVVCQKAAIGGLTHPVCKNSQSIDGVFSSLVYKGMVKKLVYRFKYPPHITNLKSLLTDFFYEGLIQKETFYQLLQQETLFIPIPLHASKMRKRGYNQAQLLAQGLGAKFGMQVIDCLARVKNTQTQVNLSQKERAENIKEAFVIKKEYLNKLNKVDQVFLVDDVVTSGATLKEAAKILKNHGVRSVCGVTLAHGE